jgi:V8-like Glu-specific endopeptidase
VLENLEERLLLTFEPVSNTTGFPWRAVVKIETTLPTTPRGDISNCSGAMIDSFHVLTAGHCVYDQGWPTSAFKVIPGKNGTSEPYGEAYGTYARTYQAFADGNWQYDMALITLDRPIGQQTGWFGYEAQVASSVNSAGYPAERYDGAHMYHTYGAVRGSADNYLYASRTSSGLYFEGGQSGSPIWRYDGTNNYIEAVHRGYNNSDYLGVRINSSRFADLQQWMSQDRQSGQRRCGGGIRCIAERDKGGEPGTLPDLTDYDQWFHTSVASFSPFQVRAGDFFRASSRVYNVGMAAGNNVAVAFYATTNPSNPRSGYFLGRATASSVPALGSTDVTWSGAMPNIPAGHYYVGWVIDPDNAIPQYNRTAHTGYVSGTQLTVLPPYQPPVAGDDAYSLEADTLLSISAPGVLHNAHDPNGLPLTAHLVNGPAHGVLALNSDGSFVYTPSSHYIGRDTFTYRVNDGRLDSNIATVTLTVIAPPLTAQGRTVSATEGAAFNGPIAVLTSPGTPGNYTIQITWGDGQVSPGTITSNDQGGFDIGGTHTYVDAGSYAVTVTITDAAGATATASSTAQIADAPLTASGTTLQTTEGARFQGAVASFTDANPNATPEKFTATITWGDGQTSAGMIMANSQGGFMVRGTHTYVDAGSDAVTVTITDAAGATATAASTAQIADAPLTASGTTLQTLERARFQGAVASFTDANPNATPEKFTATITWGDGQTSVGTITANGQGGFMVRGTHTYGDAGSYAVTVAIKDAAGATARAASTAQIADAPLTASGPPLQTLEGAMFQGTVASFTDANPNATPEKFTATIAWGDGQTAPGAITANSSGGFTVSGTHTYAREGSYSVTVSIRDVGGAEATATSTAQVTDAPLAATGRTVVATERGVFHGVLASFTDPGSTGSVDPYSATITWGDGQTSAGTITANGQGGFDVQGSNTYAHEGPYPVSVLISDKGGSTVTATSTAHVARASSPPANLRDVANALTHSREYFANIVTATYQRYLGRTPEAAGLEAWVQLLQNGLTDERLEAGFIGSPEYIRNHGGTGEAWVKGMYHDLLGRAPDAAGLNAWLDQLQHGADPAAIALGFAASAEREGQHVTADYQRYLGRPPVPAEVNRWVDLFVHDGVRNEDVVGGFVGSPEYFQGKYGNARDWLFSAYQDILGRQLDEAGANTWLGILGYRS